VLRQLARWCDAHGTTVDAIRAQARRRAGADADADDGDGVAAEVAAGSVQLLKEGGRDG
jgi:hypothetical protein